MLHPAIPVLHVGSAAEAEAFYAALGFEVAWRGRADEALADPCYLEVARGGARLHLSSFSGDGVSGAAVFLPVEAVDDLHREFRGKGVPIALSPTDQTWGTREMYVRDPDGNCLRFVQEAR
jgi:catechol 2,3-dioxygenase-like lactoylglutathione lyase family enzyme